MEVSAAFLCDFAEVREGLLMAVAGGVTRVWRQEYPTSVGTTLALLLNVSQSELEVPHDIKVSLQGPDAPVGEVQGGFQIGRAPDLEPGEMVIAPVAIDLRPLQLPGPGSYSLHLSIDGLFQQTVSFVSKPRPD